MVSKPYKSTVTGFLVYWLINGLCKDQPDISGYTLDYALFGWSSSASETVRTGSQRGKRSAASAAPKDSPTAAGRRSDYPGRGYPDPGAGGLNRARLPAAAGTVAL